MKDELLLHIGAHKTGTTTIQHGLSTQGAALAAQGVSYATVGSLPNLHDALGPLRKDPHFAPDGFGLRNPAALLSALDAAEQPRVIASSENFSFFFDPARIAALAKPLGRLFGRVRVLSYLRRQDRHVISHHQEGAKVSRRAEELLFGYDTKAIPPHTADMDLYLDYNRRIGHWIDVFGAENVTIRVFDPARLPGGDVWPDFLAAAGLDPAALDRPESRNQSLGLTRAKIGHMMNARHLAPGLRNTVLATLPEDERQMPARAEAEAFYARYREGNAALARRLGLGDTLFSEDFSDYPEAAAEDWSEAQANRAIGVLLDLLGQQLDAIGAGGLRDAALLAEQADRPDLALALMRAASRLRPEGSLIKRKLAQYTEAAREKRTKA